MNPPMFILECHILPKSLLYTTRPVSQVLTARNATVMKLPWDLKGRSRPCHLQNTLVETPSVFPVNRMNVMNFQALILILWILDINFAVVKSTQNTQPQCLFQLNANHFSMLVFQSFLSRRLYKVSIYQA